MRCGHEDDAVGGVGLDELVDLVGDVGRRADERLAPGDVDDQVADAEVLGLGPLRATRPPSSADRGTSGPDPG